jgi:hypothetical protein
MSERNKKWFVPVLCTVLGVLLTTSVAWAKTTSDRITTNEKDIATLKADVKHILENTNEIKADFKDYIRAMK